MTNCKDTFIASDGAAIPCIGYGTWQTPDGDTAKNCVKNALAAGYRHIDTAAVYGNEDGVGEGIRASGVAREDIFLTTKHWITERGYDKTIAAAECSLKNLGTDYIDLYLIHWPCVEKISPDWAEINLDTWRGFEKLHRDGKIKHLGVSNFLPHHLEILMGACDIKPVVNQIEFHPGYTQPGLVKWCSQNNILVQAWSPLGSGAVLSNKQLAEIGKRYNKSVAQLCIKYALQKNVLPLPKSINAERIKQNIDIFDFTINDEDIDVIDSLPLMGYSDYYPDDAPADAL